MTATVAAREGMARHLRHAQALRRFLLPAAVAVALLLAALALAQAVAWVEEATRIEVVRVEGAFGRVTRADIERSLGSLVAGHALVGVPMADIRRELMALSWVEAVDVYRVWPHGLIVRVTEKVPVAHWNGDGYISHAGEVFQPESTAGTALLPSLRGPADKAVQVMEFYHDTSRMLMPLGLSVRELALNDQLSWEIVTDNGMRIRVDQQESLPRLRRFLRVYEKHLFEIADRVGSVDLRYIGGFAVGWRPPVAAVTTDEQAVAVATGGENGQEQQQ